MRKAVAHPSARNNHSMGRGRRHGNVQTSYRQGMNTTTKETEILIAHARRDQDWANLLICAAGWDAPEPTLSAAERIELFVRGFDEDREGLPDADAIFE